MSVYNKIDQPEILKHLFDFIGTEPIECPDDVEEAKLTAEEGVTLECRFYKVASDSPVLLLFPATTETSQSLDSICRKFNKHGMSVILLPYRGQGNNGGTPSVANMFGDGQKLFALLQDWLKSKGNDGPLFVMGQSLGSVCAVDVVLKNLESVKGMILESGICETISFLEAVGVEGAHLSMTEEDGFNTIEKIKDIKLPTIIFHGARDGLVSVAQAENLQAFSGARSKQFFVIPGAEHHNVAQTGGDLYYQTIKTYVDTVCGVNTWRRRRKSFRDKKNG